MNIKRFQQRQPLAALLATLLLSGCITITDPIQEPPIIRPSTTPETAAMAILPSRTATRTPRPHRQTPTPSPTVAFTPTATPEPRTYQVVDGDNLSIIAKRFEISTEALVAANGMTDADSVTVGQLLIIPSSSQIVAVEAQSGTPIPTPKTEDGNLIHFVQVGETLSAIAAQYGIARDDILLANGLRPDVQLVAGDTLVIPVGSYTAIPTVTATMPVATTVPTLVVAFAQTPTATPVPNTPTPAPTATPTLYTVQEGEVAGIIARKFGISVAELAAANPGVNMDRLQIGQSLVIPPPSSASVAVAATSPTPITLQPSATPTPQPDVMVTHVVVEGDTFDSVAGKYAVTVEKLRAANSELSGEPTPAQVLQVPIGTATPLPTSTPLPTMTPTPAPAYMTPVLISPTNDSYWVHRTGKTPPILVWTAVGQLKSDEFYVVRLRAVDESSDLLWSISYWTQTPSWRLTPEILERVSGRYTLRWDVMVMQRTGGSDADPMGEGLSGKSQTHSMRVTNAAE